MAAKLLMVRLLLVLLIVVNPEAKLLVDDSHFVIVPVYPLNVSTLLLDPEHTVEPPLIVPPIAFGKTVTDAELLFALKQPAAVFVAA